MDSELPDLVLNGVGQAAAGRYGGVSLEGVCTVQGRLPDLKLTGNASTTGGRFGRIKITGETSIYGNAGCLSLKCLGTVAVKGNLESDAFALTGECKVGGDFRYGRIRATGDIETGGSMRGDNLKLTGRIASGGSCEAELMQIRGLLEVEGILSADRLELTMYGPCRAGEIGGSMIAVRMSRAAVMAPVFRHLEPAVLHADSIEGDTIDLTATHAQIVRGGKVTIGPGCTIGRVEYRESIRVSRGAAVKEKVKL